MHRFPKSGFLTAAGGGLLSVVLLTGCSDPALCVSLTEWPKGATRLKVSTTLGGKPGEDRYVELDHTKFCVELPADAMGDVVLDIAGIDGVGCKVAELPPLRDSVPSGLFHHYYYSKTLTQSATYNRSGWCRLEPSVAGYPSLSEIKGLWGDAADNVWLLDYSGTLMHWNGSAWSLISESAPPGTRSMWGSPGNSLWSVGSTGMIMRFAGNQPDAMWTPSDRLGGSLRSIWGSGPNDLWTVGDGGIIKRSAGDDSWMLVSGTPPVTMDNLNGVWGSGRDDVWAVGEVGTILHNDQGGAAPWSAPEPAVSTEDLYDVWGSSEDDVWAVGASGTILHRTGDHLWAPPSNYHRDESKDLHAVWGSSANKVWAVGTDGIILYWNGSQWTQVESGTSKALQRVWGTKDGEVWVGGAEGTLLHYAGSPKPL